MKSCHIRLMEEILHHLRWVKPYKQWDNHHPWWCRISSINSISCILKCYLPVIIAGHGRDLGRFWGLQRPSRNHHPTYNYPLVNYHGNGKMFPERRCISYGTPRFPIAMLLECRCFGARFGILPNNEIGESPFRVKYTLKAWSWRNT